MSYVLDYDQGHRYSGETHITVTCSLPCYAGICVWGTHIPRDMCLGEHNISRETHITVTPVKDGTCMENCSAVCVYAHHWTVPLNCAL